LDPVIELDEQRLNIMKALDIPLLVLTCARDDESSLKIIRSLAQQELSSRFFVGLMTDSSFAGAIETAAPFLTVFNALDQAIPMYDGPFATDKVLEFANKVSSPLIRQFDTSSLAMFMKVGARGTSFQI
jgi:hypothetical protein